MRNERERRQSQVTADVVGCTDGIVKVIEKESQADARRQGQQHCDKNVSRSLGPDRGARRDGAVLDLDVVGPIARERELLLLLPLNICVEERPLFDLALHAR